MGRSNFNPITPTATASSERTLLDQAGIAHYACVTERMARRILGERRVPIVRVGRHRRVWSSDLEAWLEAHTTPAVS